MHIQIEFDEQGALRNQRHAFSNRFTLVSELLQNARRAGATLIDVRYDPDAGQLSVHDDGHGLQDFRHLLHFHASGWGDEVAAQEQPFGIGFSKCLYAASHCRVTSGRQRVDIDTEAALRREAFAVTETEEAVSGTRVELHGVDLHGLDERMEALCQGFPVAVRFNGSLLPRRYAVDSLSTVETPVGQVHLAGTASGLSSFSTLVFLQGFAVHAPYGFEPDQVNVVHLDARQFLARLPDRDKLIDEDRQLARVYAELSTLWHSVLLEARQHAAPQAFVDTYFAAMQGWGHLAIMNDLEVLPAAPFQRVRGYPIQSRAHPLDYLQPLATAPTRQSLEAGDVVLVDLERLDEDNAALWMLARHKGWVLVRSIAFPVAHWLQALVRHPQREQLSVLPVEPLASADFEGRSVRAVVTLCHAVRVRLGTEFADILDAPVCTSGAIFVPAHAKGGEAVRQLAGYMSAQHELLDADLQADRHALAQLIQRLRCPDAAATLDSLLHDMRLEIYPLLHGKSFAVTVGTGQAPTHTVRLADSPATPAVPRGALHAGR